MPEAPRPFAVDTRDGVALSGEQSGEGTPVVLLHGLTATRRYVVMGSRLLQRSGYRVVSYDARGHGRSAPAPHPSAYTYELLARDLECVLDALEIDRAVLAGVSMGAHTAVRFALDRPSRVAALALITPGFDPERATASDEALADWHELADGLRRGGIDGFLAAYGLAAVPERWREQTASAIGQRLSEHEHPLAVADALRTLPSSRPFQAWGELAAIVAPTLVLGSQDDADPGHPLAIAERYAQAVVGAELVVEGVGESPLAWQGGRLSQLLARLANSNSEVAC